MLKIKFILHIRCGGTGCRAKIDKRRGALLMQLDQSFHRPTWDRARRTVTTWYTTVAVLVLILGSGIVTAQPAGADLPDQPLAISGASAPLTSRSLMLLVAEPLMRGHQL